MKQCKHLYNCKKNMLTKTLLEACGWSELICMCNDYEPSDPEIDPYWKDIFDETNRRLYER